ncbi:MAG: hydrogenase maturation protease [Anaerolineales bacterium]|nr:hydrogenase maturation protease [Anaerolineales bacterium]
MDDGEPAGNSRLVGSSTGGAGSVALSPVLVIGFGSPFRSDDGVGPRIIEELQVCALPSYVELIDGGTEGLDIVHLVEGRRKVIVIDAASMGQRPGSFVRFTMNDASLLDHRDAVSAHVAALGDGLRLAQALGVLPSDVVIFGLQPVSLDWGRGLSPEVEAAVPDLVVSVLAEIPPDAGSMRLP